jgi:hypothetical protein
VCSRDGPGVKVDCPAAEYPVLDSVPFEQLMNPSRRSELLRLAHVISLVDLSPGSSPAVTGSGRSRDTEHARRERWPPVPLVGCGSRRDRPESFCGGACSGGIHRRGVRCASTSEKLGAAWQQWQRSTFARVRSGVRLRVSGRRRARGRVTRSAAHTRQFQCSRQPLHVAQRRTTGRPRQHRQRFRRAVTQQGRSSRSRTETASAAGRVAPGSLPCRPVHRG